MFILSETWISMVATGAARGRVLTAYTSVLAGGFAVRAAVLPLAVAVVSPVLALGPLVVAGAACRPCGPTAWSPVRSLVRLLSVLLVGVLAVSVFDTVSPQFLPSYGLA
jgi:hypothetical protein